MPRECKQRIILETRAQRLISRVQKRLHNLKQAIGPIHSSGITARESFFHPLGEIVRVTAVFDGQKSRFCRRLPLCNIRKTRIHYVSQHR